MLANVRLVLLLVLVLSLSTSLPTVSKADGTTPRTLSTLDASRVFGGSGSDRCCDAIAACFYTAESEFCFDHDGDEIHCTDSKGEVEDNSANHDDCLLVQAGESCLSPVDDPDPLKWDTVVCKYKVACAWYPGGNVCKSSSTDTKRYNAVIAPEFCQNLTKNSKCP